jgi:hypothetical protein
VCGQHAADRGRGPATLCGRLEFGHRLALGLQARREDPPVPVAGDDPGAVARQFVGELLRVTDAEHLVTRKSAPVDLATSWVATASRLLISRRSPSMVTTTLSLSASTSSADRFSGAARAGCPICVECAPARLQRPTS